MSKSKPTQRKTTIELTARGVFQISIDSGWRDGAKENRARRSACAPSANRE